MLDLLQAIPDSGAVKQGADWLQDGYTLAAVIAIVFGGVIWFLAKRLLAISDANDKRLQEALAEITKRKAVPNGD